MTDTTRARLRAFAAISLLAALLAGCTGIPLDGPARTETISVDDGGDDLVTIAEGPTPGAAPEQLIAGFLTAQRAPAGDYRIARDFLTDEFRTEWSPTSRVLITNTTMTPTRRDGNVFASTATVLAVVNGTGNYQNLPRAESQELQYQLVQNDEGEWRISSAPEGTILTASQFSNTFGAYPLYFYEPVGSRLVPDVRWFPKTASRAVRIVTELLRGQSPWYANGVLVTAFPADTKLDQGVSIEGGKASVDLSNNVTASSPEELFRMQQQLVATLALSDVSSVQITVGGLPVEVGSGTIPEWSLAVPSSPVGLSEAGFGALSSSSVRALPEITPRVASLELLSATIARGGAAAAVRTPRGAYSVGAGGGDPVLVDTRAGLVDPSIDSLGYVWSAVAGSADSIVAFEPNGTPHPIAAPYLEGTISALELSRDGARLLVATQDDSGPSITIVGVLRDGDGVPMGFGEPLELALDAGSMIDATWVDASTIATLSAAGQATQVDLYQIGGRHEPFGSLQNGAQLVGGNSADGLRVRDGDGRVWRHNSSGGWQATSIVVSFLATQL